MTLWLLPPSSLYGQRGRELTFWGRGWHRPRPQWSGRSHWGHDGGGGHLVGEVRGSPGACGGRLEAAPAVAALQSCLPLAWWRALGQADEGVVGPRERRS